jgi:uncharacterized protein (TIGR02246 family)
MKRRIAAVLTVGFALAAAGCNAPDTRDADVKALKDLEAQWVKDIATKDPEKWVAYYTDDASFLPQGSPTVTGKEALRGLIKSLVSDPNFALTFQSSRQEVGKSGDLGYTQGSYTMTVSNPETKQPMTDKGKYLTVFKKLADGSWKAVSDMISSDGPAPAAK